MCGSRLVPDVTAIRAAAVHAAVGLDRHGGVLALTHRTDVTHTRTDGGVRGGGGCCSISHLFSFCEAATLTEELGQGLLIWASGLGRCLHRSVAKQDWISRAQLRRHP